MNEKYMVFVRCSTYNHSAYIKDALDGFCMQQTAFPFVCCIIDDASTDGEQDIIRQYLEEHFNLFDSNVATINETNDYTRLYAQHKDNKNCFFVAVYLKYNHYRIKKPTDQYVAEWRDSSKYIALCEGDDFWIEEFKLQKQFAFMESHPNHSLCFCAYKELFPDGTIRDKKRYPYSMEKCSMSDIILGGGGYMSTNTMFFRNASYVPYTMWAKNCPVGDLPQMLTMSALGDVAFISEIMCVYRVSVSGSWSSRMLTNSSLRKSHFRAIQTMWHQFDVWTDKKYHHLVIKKKWRNRITFYKDEIRALIR